MSEVLQECSTEKSNPIPSVEEDKPRAASSLGSPEVCGAATPFPYVVKTPRADSKLILQNMEEVLNSVKRKHKQKHRRKKEQKKKAQQEAEAAAAENAANADVAKTSQKSPKHPLQESKENVDEMAAEMKSPMKTATILDHFARTPKKQKDVAESSPGLNGVGVVAKKANAFEVMMNARNKSIGSNTPGKDAPAEECYDEQKSGNVKRKMFLQEWAERKGGNKRRLEEEAKDAYIDKTMKHRAKRLKAMLTNGHIEKPNDEKPAAAVSEKPIEKSATKASTPREPLGRKSKRHSRHTRRLSSVDSTDSHEIPCQESTGFLSKLSSPIKKRDSLLGYFSKKPSPAEEAKVNKDLQDEALPDSTPIRKKRGRLSKQQPKVITPVEVEAESETLTASGRPKRQCSGKSKYDLDVSPPPLSTYSDEKHDTRSSKKSNKEAAPEIETIDLDCESPQHTPKKLAPLFIKAVPKPSPNPELVRAKQKFLMSGVPEKMRLEMAKQKQYEQSYEEAVEVFPRISHIKQLSDEDMNAEDLVVTFKLRRDEDQKTPTRKIRKRVIGALTTCTLKDFRGQHKAKSDIPNSFVPLQQIENKRLVVKDWKVAYDRFPTYRCYNQLREKYRYFSAIDSGQEAEQVTESFVVTRSSSRRSCSKAKFDPDAEEEKPPPSAPNGELLFTEKYKAMSSDQVLVNVAPVNQLKEFLSSWRGAARVNDSAVNFDINESSSSNSATSSSVVLVGPNSSGKTNAVFALANEMNFNVLEINAGMKRTGKKLLQELQEATQSHQIRKDTNAKGKNLFKMTLNGNKKKKHTTDDSSTELDLEQTARKSLILVEDADVIFEQHDAGFVDALYTLSSTSKRPVIIVVTNPNCQHLQRLINQNSIKFAPPNVLNISKFLSVLALIENCPVDLNDLVSLYLFNRKQLRRTLLELQFYIQSGGDRPKGKKTTPPDEKGGAQYFASPTKRRFSEESVSVSESGIDAEIESSKKKSESSDVMLHKGLFEFYTVCQNMKCRIPFPVDFHLLRTNLPQIFQVSRNLQEPNASTRRKSKSPKKAWLSAAKRPSVIESLSDFYENLSVSTMIAGVQESEDRLTINLSEDLAHCLAERAIERNLSACHYAYNLFETPQDSYILTNLTPVVPLRSTRSLSLDYEPSLRSICRSERLRSGVERRGSRFYHYLRNSANMGSFSMDNFDQACDILTDPSIQVIAPASQ